MPERQLDGVRTHGELTRLTAALVAGRPRLAWREERDVACAQALLFDETGSLIIARAGRIMRYDAELIAQDASRTRRTAALEIRVPDGTPGAVVADLDGRFSRLTARGIAVSVVVEGDDDRALAAARVATSREDRPLAMDAEAAALARRLMHELQKERVLMASVAGPAPLGTALEEQFARTQAALATVGAFVESCGTERRHVTIAYLAGALESFERVAAVRCAVVERRCDVAAIVVAYSEVTACLLDVVTALGVAVRDAALVRPVAAYIAFVCAKEEAALEATEVAYVLAVHSCDAGHELTLAVLTAAERSGLAIFRAMAAPEIQAVYDERSADPAFTEIARIERTACENGLSVLRIDSRDWIAGAVAKLDRLKEIGYLQSRALFARIATV